MTMVRDYRGASSFKAIGRINTRQTKELDDRLSSDWFAVGMTGKCTHCHQRLPYIKTEDGPQCFNCGKIYYGGKECQKTSFVQ